MVRTGAFFKYRLSIAASAASVYTVSRAWVGVEIVANEAV